MSKISDLISEVEAAVDAARARVEADETVDQQSITDLRAEVARLQALIDSGEATPAQEAALASIKDKLASIEASVNG